MWDLPRPGHEPVSPALAGRFSTTAPPGKPGNRVFKKRQECGHAPSAVRRGRRRARGPGRGRPGAGGGPAEAGAAAEDGAGRRGDGAVQAGAGGGRRRGPRRVQDPGGPAGAERGAPRRLADAQCLCAGRKLASEPQDPAAAPLPTPGVPETRGRNKGSGAFGGGGPALPERGVREGSGQRMPRRPRATRLPKRGGPGKSPAWSST